MGAPDLSGWIWPDAGQGRAPTAAFQLDTSNPLLAGLVDYIIPANPATYKVATGTLAATLDPVGRAFSGTMRLDGNGPVVNSAAPYSLVCVTRMPTTLSGFLAACSIESSSSFKPWLGYSSDGGVTASNSNIDVGVAATAGALYVIVGVYDAAGNVTAYVNGILAGTGATGGTATPAKLCVMDYGGGGFSYTGKVHAALAFNRALSAGEVGAIGTPQAVFSLFAPPKLGIRMAASGGVTGTAASTQQPNVSAASGSIRASGAAASTQQVNASSAAGAIGLAGAAASPQGKNVSAATGGILVSGLGASLQAANSDSASGSIVVSGSAASSQQLNASSASGAITVAGSSASTQAPNVSSTTGAIVIAGSASSTQAPNVSNASGAIGSVVQGSAASTQNPNVSVASGSVSMAGSASSSQGQNVSTASGSVKVSGAASSVQALNVSSASGVIGTPPLTGSAASTQAANTSLAVGAIKVSGSASSTQTANSSAASGSIRIAGSAGGAQQPNVSAATGVVIPAAITGTAASVQQANVSAATGQVGVSAYPVNPSYYVKLALRPFYAQSPTRQFYGAAPARFFYIKPPARSFYAATPVRSFYVRCNSMLSTIPMMSPKGPLETVVVTLDATLELAPGETLTGTPSPVVTTQIGTDSTPSLTLANAIVNSQAIVVNGNSIAIGAAVQAVATLGQFSSSYLISATVTTSNPDKVLTLQAILPMRSQ